MNKRLAAGILSILIGISGAFYVNSRTVDAQQVQQGIAQEIIRFHVLANSDSDEDQNLKLKVKDHIVNYMKDILKDSNNIEETRTMIQENLTEIEKEAAFVIRSEGYSFTVNAALTTCYFPIKTYGDCTFPEGNYEALRITIGEAKGKNWWCVLYPNLCFVDATHAVVPDPEKQELKNVLTEKEYDTVTSDPELKIKFKYLSFLNK